MHPDSSKQTWNQKEKGLYILTHLGDEETWVFGKVVVGCHLQAWEGQMLAKKQNEWHWLLSSNSAKENWKRRQINITFQALARLQELGKLVTLRKLPWLRSGNRGLYVLITWLVAGGFFRIDGEFPGFAQVLNLNLDFLSTPLFSKHTASPPRPSLLW